MSVEYFEIAGALLLIYAVMRIGIWHSLQLPPIPPERRNSEPGKPIDTTVLAERLHHVRQDHQTELPARPESFKKQFQLEAKREEVAKLAFFQKPPAPEPPEEEHGGTSALLLV